MLVEARAASAWRCNPITSAHDFPRKYRLTQKHQYDYVLATRAINVRSGCLRAFATPNATSTARLGVIVGKRQLRRAVDRNRVKRTMRESFRVVRPALPNLDIVVQLL